ncbi:RNA polymerase sigma factor SigJ [Streptomyces sp. NBC_00887]|uniref:RNA polymerase sigma factor SigJ n=1 Tax=Streptomyces sp. NBC_00887 TaxID=2975859 RepID=UPI00386E84F5|nr:RNA polymerase sigma factor SigJ [Streptomyces sp. NBC_00887]WSY36311.1 RNA polymerase sigma factor SigJ [Streptomyces sp. NBC_00887]
MAAKPDDSPVTHEAGPARDAPRGQGTGQRQDEPAHGATQLFVDHRELLFSVVYNMLGSVADTEDVLQETWLSWSGKIRRTSLAEIDNPRAYLVRIAVNHALGRQTAIAFRRETYVGPWLPEPLVTDATAGLAPDTADHAVRTDSVSIAMLVVLETLTPLERAVFVLHEVFGYPHTEIAGMLDRQPAAVRQLARRARSHVHARRPRYHAHPRVRREATERFVAAALGGDIHALMEILAPDVTVWIDGGGARQAAGLRPVHGREKAARMLAGYATRRTEDLDIRYRRVNGDDAAVLFTDDSPYAVMVMDLTPDGDQVSGVYIVTNPAKLTHVGPDKLNAPDEVTAPGRPELCQPPAPGERA